MKSLRLIAFILLYVIVFWVYSVNIRPAKILLAEIFPQYFSPDNPDVITVSQYSKYKKFSSSRNTIPVANTKYTYKPTLFKIDDTDGLKKLDLVCEPDSFGYTVAEGLKVFPPYSYPRCSIVNKQPGTYMHIDREHNTIYMDCPDDENNQILTGPNDDKKMILRQEGHIGWKLKDYEGPIKADGIEFALGSCEKDGDFLNQVDMAPIFNQSAYDEAKPKVSGKPKIVYFLTLDSLSRRHFFRKLPKVVNFLNDLNKDSNFSVFDFKLHNNMGETSPRNQEPIFSGRNDYPGYDDPDKNKDILGDLAIWNKLRAKGYVNLMAFEDCDGSFVNYVGRYPDIEYTVNPFYCAVEKFTESNYRKTGTLQRCLGGYMSHHYILNFTDNVVDMNKGVNLMLYVHLSAGHEYTGQHAETLNEDIRDYLHNFIGKYEKDFELLIFLQADHGMRYGDFFKDLDAYQENKLPAFFLIASKSLLNRFPYSYHTLNTNTQRLVSKVDYRKTVLEMEGIIEENSLNINLLTQIASKSRTCYNLGIRPWDCSCLKMTEIKHPKRSIRKLIASLINYAEFVINSDSYASPLYPIGQICKRVELGKVTKIYHTGINNVEELYKLEVESPTKDEMKFQITYLLASGTDKRMENTKERFSKDSYLYEYYPIQSRILSISRLDSYGGECEVKARTAGVRAEFCVCQ